MTIGEYVTSTRRIVRETDPGLRSVYNRFFAETAQALVRDYPKEHLRLLLPYLFVTYSQRRSCEVVRLGGITYLIYDQYLGQTFNKLNWIFLNSSSPMDVVAYGYKLFAEKLVVLGLSHLAYQFAGAHRLLQYDPVCWSDRLNETPDKELVRAAYTSAQECFVILHELAHIVIRL